MSKDLYNSIAPLTVIAPISVSNNTSQVGQIIDSRGYDSVTYVIATGAIADADATFVVLLEEDDASDMSSAYGVPDSNLLGTEDLAGFRFDDDNKTRKLGYNGTKRYTRLTITPVINASAALISCFAILGNPATA